MGTVLIASPNPAIDKTAIVPGFSLGNIHRPHQVIQLAGGKGLNVARTITTLGYEARACLLLGGHGGAWIEGELKREGIAASIVWAAGETRTCLSILDPDSSTLTELYEDGSPITPAEWERFEALVAGGLDSVEMATFSGSLPPGAPADGFARLVRMSRTKSVSACVDTYSEPLRLALDSGPDLLKVNASEASEVMGWPICAAAEAATAASQLVTHGIKAVIITLGKTGAVAASQDGAWFAAPPPVQARSPVGSGDALLGGVVSQLVQRKTLPEALGLGVAVAAANTVTIGACVFQPAIAMELARQVKVERL
jgi:1-phosphofructokinase family hexose kinase